MNYDIWQKNLLNCRFCKLCETRNQVVVGDGNLNAKIFCVGEAPGADEDRIGKPFVGRSGKFLRKILFELGFSINDMYISNIVKCRPPNNRDPEIDEITACSQYLITQIKDIVKPKIVIGIGRISSLTIYKNYICSRDHGKLIELGNYLFMGTYHPAAAMRNPDFKKKMINDWIGLKKFLKNESKTNFF